MTITPDQARELLDGATPGPWWIHPAYGTVEPDVISGEGCRFVATDEDLNLSAKAPGMAQTIAGMRVEWGVERDLTGTAYIDGTVARRITWIGDEARARKACAMSTRGGNPLLVRRLVGPTEHVNTDQENPND